MKIVEYVTIAVLALVSTYFPWITTINYGILGALLVMQYHPLWLSIVSILAATLGTSSLWFADSYTYRFFSRFFRPFNADWNKSIWTKVQSFFLGIHSRLHLVSRKDILFFLVIVWTQAAIPDLLIVRATKGRLPFWLFLFATIIGKSIVYAPIIYGIEFLKRVRESFF